MPLPLVSSSTAERPGKPRTHIQPPSTRVQGAPFQSTATLSFADAPNKDLETQPKPRPPSLPLTFLSQAICSSTRPAKLGMPCPLHAAFFLACKLGLNLQWCPLHACLELSQVPTLSWYRTLEASHLPCPGPCDSCGDPKIRAYFSVDQRS